MGVTLVTCPGALVAWAAVRWKACGARTDAAHYPVRAPPLPGSSQPPHAVDALRHACAPLERECAPSACAADPDACVRLENEDGDALLLWVPSSAAPSVRACWEPRDQVVPAPTDAAAACPAAQHPRHVCCGRIVPVKAAGCAALVLDAPPSALPAAALRALHGALTACTCGAGLLSAIAWWDAAGGGAQPADDDPQSAGGGGARPTKRKAAPHGDPSAAPLQHAPPCVCPRSLLRAAQESAKRTGRCPLTGTAAGDVAFNARVALAWLLTDITAVACAPPQQGTPVQRVP